MQIDRGSIPGPAAAANRLTALAGVAIVLLVAIGFLVAPVWDAPGSTSTADQLDAYVRTHRGALLASLLLYSVAMGLFLCPAHLDRMARRGWRNCARRRRRVVLAVELL
jgi:hypothetical protein